MTDDELVEFYRGLNRRTHTGAGWNVTALKPARHRRVDERAEGWAILAGYDSRGYPVVLYRKSGQRHPVMVKCGCREFTLPEARKHWFSKTRNFGKGRRKTATQILMLIGVGLDQAADKGYFGTFGVPKFNTKPRNAVKR